MARSRLRRTSADRLKLLAASSRDGRTGVHRAVPVVGTGLNIQAALEVGARADDWAGLLRRIFDEARVPERTLRKLPESFIQQWECVVRILAVHRYGHKPFEAENDLRKVVCEHYRAVETEHVHDLHHRFAGAGFRDIVSLNFDRRLALSRGARQVRTMVSGFDGVDEVTLFRHSLVTGPGGATRIWYPHGDTKRSDTIKLGIRRYGTYIKAMEGLRGEYMNRWYAADEAYPRKRRMPWIIPPDAWDDEVREWKDTSWVDVMFAAPLVFIGCSLSLDEWGLWWLLNQRARHTAFLDQKQERGSAIRRPDTFILWAGDPPPHFKGRPSYLDVLPFASHAEMWAAIEAAFMA